MFTLGPAPRIYLALGATDMRKGDDGLSGLVRDKLGLEVRTGHLSCLLMPEGTGSSFYTGMAPAFGAAPNGWNVEDLAGQ